MNDFDDELRRILRDDRIALTPRADAVERIVKGARRRRTVRLVASAAGSVGLVAAVAIGSLAAAGQFSAGPSYEPEPIVTPTVLPGPVDTARPDPSGEPLVLDPVEPFDGVHVRMTVEELEQVPGVEITRLRGDTLDPTACYGEYRTARAHGYISVRGVIGSVPEDSDDLMALYEVATLVPDVPVQTPEGIGPGSTVADVWQAYPEWFETEPGVYGSLIPGLPGIVSYWQIETTDGYVSQVSHDGRHNCGDNPQPLEEAEEPDLPVIGPTGLADIRIGMTIAELEAVPGVVVEEFTADHGRSDECFGQFRLGPARGLISYQYNRSTGQLVDEVFRVSYLTSDEPVQTPAGLTIGATEEQVRAVHPNLEVTNTAASVRVEGSDTTVYHFAGIVAEPAGPAVVTAISLDGGQTCAG